VIPTSGYLLNVTRSHCVVSAPARYASSTGRTLLMTGVLMVGRDALHSRTVEPKNARTKSASSSNGSDRTLS
jgi:tartrate dehydratase beta subunit/fumarate hydratase class I family protein